MNVEYLSGFFDGEGSFIARIRTDSRYRLGTHIELCIDITQKNRIVLDQIKEFVGFGYIYFNSTYNLYQFRIHKIQDIQKFTNLISAHLIVKQKDMEIFSKCVDMVLKKDHLNAKSVTDMKETVLFLQSRTVHTTRPMQNEAITNR